MEYSDVRCIAIQLVLFFGALLSQASAQDSYSNSGDNTTGFAPGSAAFIPGTPFGGSFVSDGTIIGESAGTWDTLPVTLTGNFQISYQVYNNSTDGDSHLLLLNLGTTGGIDVKNSPQNTDSPSINIISGQDFTNFNQFYFPSQAAILATAPSNAFPNYSWTQIVVTKTGNSLTDDVGGQIIQANLGSQGLSPTLQLGLGAYASDTQFANEGGNIYFRDIVVTPEPTSLSLAMISSIFIAGLIWTRLRHRS